MSELHNKIRAAQTAAREKAAADGSSLHAVIQAGVLAGEQVVVDHMKEVQAAVQNRLSLFFVRDVRQEEWPALPRSFKMGEAVVHFQGHTYGLDRDDMLYCKRETVPCCLQIGDAGFFTVPVDMLRNEAGEAVHGAYVQLPFELMGDKTPGTLVVLDVTPKLDS